MYEGSSRIPLIVAGPGIEQGKIIKNLTQIIDVLPTLIELGAGNHRAVPEFLNGQSLVRFLKSDSTVQLSNVSSITNTSSADDKSYFDTGFKDYIMSQYHSTLGNTGTFMIRRNEYKYIQFGHYLPTFMHYQPMLYNVDNDPWELNDLGRFRDTNETINSIMNEMEILLRSEVNYEYVDCKAKQNDFKIFEKFFFRRYGPLVKKNFAERYKGFNDNDWNKIIDWRNEMISLGNGDITACDYLLDL